MSSAGRSDRRRPIWIEQAEGANFWLKVFNELRSRGVGDILIAVVDGLKGRVLPASVRELISTAA